MAHSQFKVSILVVVFQGVGLRSRAWIRVCMEVGCAVRPCTALRGALRPVGLNQVESVK